MWGAEQRSDGHVFITKYEHPLLVPAQILPTCHPRDTSARARSSCAMAVDMDALYARSLVVC